MSTIAPKSMISAKTRLMEAQFATIPERICTNTIELHNIFYAYL